jgi:hypothetical protein
MPLRNRVTPFGDLIADPARGLVYGNRGCLHDEHGRIRRHHATRRWIGCRLEFRGWHRGALMQPGRFTELFFLDEATAFAAGHRPCAIDAQLHWERLVRGSGTQRHHDASLDGLPDGAFVLREEEPWVVVGDDLWRWTPACYVDRTPRSPREPARVITPPSLVSVLRSGCQPLVPLLHPSAV